MLQVIEKNDKNESCKLFLKEVGSRMREFRKKRGITCEIKSLYEQGMPLKTIAKKYGVTISGVSRFVKSKGWRHSQPNKAEFSRKNTQCLK